MKPLQDLEIFKNKTLFSTPEVETNRTYWSLLDKYDPSHLQHSTFGTYKMF